MSDNSDTVLTSSSIVSSTNTAGLHSALLLSVVCGSSVSPFWHLMFYFDLIWRGCPNEKRWCAVPRDSCHESRLLLSQFTSSLRHTSHVTLKLSYIYYLCTLSTCMYMYTPIIICSDICDMFAGLCDGESRDLQRGAGGVRQLRRARPPPQDRGLLHPALPAQVPTPQSKYFYLDLNIFRCPESSRCRSGRSLRCRTRWSSTPGRTTSSSRGRTTAPATT